MGVRRWWNEQAVPRLTDRGLDDATATRWRSAVCGGATGEVLEIGFGSGRNLAYYPGEVNRVLEDFPWHKLRLLKLRLCTERTPAQLRRARDYATGECTPAGKIADG